MSKFVSTIFVSLIDASYKSASIKVRFYTAHKRYKNFNWLNIACSISFLTLFQTPITSAYAGELAALSGETKNGSIAVTYFEKDTEHEASPDSSAAKTSTIGRLLAIRNNISERLALGLEYSDRVIDKTINTPPAGFTKAGRLKREAQTVTLFADINIAEAIVSPSIRMGLDAYKLERPDLLTGLLAMASSDGRHYGANIEVSKTIPIAKGLFIRPTAELDYSLITVKAFTETGAGPANISFNALEDERITGELGIALGAALPISQKLIFAPFINAKFRRNFITGPIETGAKLANGMDLGKQILSVGEEPRGYLLDAGAYIFAEDRLEILIAYQGEYFPSTTTHGFAFRANYKF